MITPSPGDKSTIKRGPSTHRMGMPVYEQSVPFRSSVSVSQPMYSLDSSVSPSIPPSVHSMGHQDKGQGFGEQLGFNEHALQAIGKGELLTNMNPIAQAGYVMAGRVIDGQIQNFKLHSWFSWLRYYFSVSNSYVLNKLKIILFPLMHNNWGRVTEATATGAPEFVPPRHDVNAPDLYIPVMAFMTYILMYSYELGSKNLYFFTLLVCFI